ncbi:MAG: pentapeptide repeat-containing protein [Syntrophobacterales bacterium]|jgi:uncharacterized protein YjbI with pentapeptide repeats|nr:pentapeptide repeat-containing protein [Syntrophobacterales bacterium]
MKKKIVSILTIVAVFPALLFIGSFSYAFKQGDLDKLRSTRECQWCDLHGVDLSGADLVGVNLSSANLTGARLSKANLTGANLAGTYLRNSNLAGADLTNAFLNKANLSGADVTDVNLTGTDMSEAVWADEKKCIKGSIGECKSARLF